MRLVRLCFSKTKAAKFISHLDLNRCMIRAVRRAKIPLWYTEGFNPHPYINFLLPLPLGIESQNDVFDIRIEGEMETNEIIRRLNAVLPEDICITGSLKGIEKPKEISFAKYLMSFDNSDITVEDLKKALASKELLCAKTVKSGRKKIEKQIDIAPYVNDFLIQENDGMICLEICLPAGSSFNVNPLLLIDALSGVMPLDIMVKNIRRIRLLNTFKESFDE